MDASAHHLDLEAMPLFAGMAHADLEHLRLSLRAESIEAGAIMIDRAKPSPDACIVLSGTLTVYVDQPDDEDVLLAMLGPGEIVGELNLIDHLGRSANVMAREPSDVLWLDETTFRTCIKQMPGLAENMLSILARRLRLANAQVQALAALSVQGRVAHQLLAFAGAYGEETENGATRIGLRLSDADLAGLIGANRANTHKMLAIFRRNTYIAIDEEHRITILDRDALERLCS